MQGLDPISSSDKYETYSKLMKRMNIAKKYGFHFEMCMIAYALMEDRTSAALRHANEKDRKSLYQKTLALKKMFENGNKAFMRSYDMNTFDEIDRWRNERNQLVHSMATMKLETEKLKTIAEDGYALSKNFSNMVTRYKRLKK